MSKHWLTASQVRLLSALADKGSLTRDQLIEAAYSDREDGGPLDAASVVKVMIWRIRKALEPHGVEIVSFDRPGCGGGCGSYGMSATNCAKVSGLLAKRRAAILGDAAARRVLEAFPESEFEVRPIAMAGE